jgi:hypothetical protein
MVEERWRLGFGERRRRWRRERGEGDARKREGRGIGKPLGCSFMIPDDYNASVFIVLSTLAS